MDNPSINGWLFGVPGYPHDYGNPHIKYWLEPPCVPRAKMASGTSNGQFWFNKFEIWTILLQIIYDNICIYYGVFFSLWLAIYTLRGFPMARPKGKFLQRHLAVDHPRCGTNLDTIADWLRVDQAGRDGRLTRRTCVNGCDICTANETLVHQQRGQVK